MSATRFAPVEHVVMDHGNAPEYFIDGLAYYREENGIVRMGFYTRENSMETGALIPVLAVRVIMAVSVERSMRTRIRQMSTATPNIYERH